MFRRGGFWFSMYGRAGHFLGVEVPDDPFPRLNEASEMRRRLLGLVALSATVPALAVLAGVAATVFIVRRVARSRYR